ncbi:hypothetical protein [Fodinibius halophilus]|uniref:Lipoprotein n=1 Tax=Fodinibius halophilus TaxID=1736908 RepID=A0A6M1T244_9BACT|nr:hypothetical protein [Fodinibius halophilus]NGP90138.1 hypothetical protein [Fodinibius halophilus]
MRKVILFISLTSVLLISCKNSTNSDELEPIYPQYEDTNANNINDYVEPETHSANHDFIDSNDDRICDLAQDGSSAWHGPGFIDNNNNGICDYWDQSHAMHSQHEGMRFHDENGDHRNDYFEEDTHWGEGHNFIDHNNDGLCDLSQDGSPTWHGPGFKDTNDNGVCDYWEEGGRGHGGMMGGHGHGG